MNPRAAGIAGVAAIAYALLGRAVAGRPPGGLWPIDAAARPIAGHAAHLAYVFTASCFWPVLVAFGIAAGVLACFRRAWRARAIFFIAVMLAGWQISDALKNLFGRPRPDYWYLRHETSFAYSSGHAMFAVVVYGLWAYYAATSDLPRPVRTALATALALWACGVLWSRLALGAHWSTDLIGGILLGVAVLAAGIAIAPRLHVIPSAGSRSEP